MIENGKPLSLSSFIDDYKTNEVFTGEYLVGKNDSKQIQQDVKDNSMIKQLNALNNTVKGMGLAVQVYPQTNTKDPKTIIGYNLVVYDPQNRDKVIGSEGEYKDIKGDYSYGKFVNVGFADSVKLGHSGINGYTDILDSDNNRIIRLKQNEAQLKIFNDKLLFMAKAHKNDRGEKALNNVKSASYFADQEMKSVELKTKSNLQDKDDDTYKSGSQMLDAMLAEKVNLSPLLEQMKWAYGIDEKYNKKVMELLSLVSHAENEAAALKYIEVREKDLKRGIKKYDGFKQAMLSIQKSGIEYDYGNTSETAYSTYKSATFNRNLIAGDVLLSPVLREQGRKNTHNLSNDENERERQIESLGIQRGILASRAGEAKDVTYAAKDIVNKRNELAYDAVVKAVEMSDKELAEKGKANLSVREGQSVVSGEYAKVLDTSHHTMNKTFGKKEFEEAKEDFAKLTKEKQDNKIDEKGRQILDEMSPYFDKDGNIIETKKRDFAVYLFTKFLKHSKMSLFKPGSDTSDSSNVNIFENDNGGYTVSGEGQVRFENGRRGTDTVGNMRSEMVENDQAFNDLHLTKANGEDAGSLASHHIQVIAGREQLDSRKYGTRMKQDLTATLIDMRSLDKLNDFFAQLKKDADSTDEIKKNSAEFFSSILELGEDGKVYITDDVKKVNKLFEKKKFKNGEKEIEESDEQAKRRLSGYLAYLDQLRDSFGGNEGLGRVYSLDKDGNLVRTENARTFYTNLGGDDNVQYGNYSNFGAVDFRTGHDSMTRALRMAVSQMTDDEKKAYRSGNKDVYDVAEDISSQFDASKKDKEELERLKQSNEESVANMRKTAKEGISVKDLNKGLDEQRYITVGKGKDYDINIDDVKTETRDKDTKEITNKEETLTFLIDKKREEIAEARKKEKIKAMEAELSEIKDEGEKEKKRAEINAFKKAKADESDLQVVIDTQGVMFGKNVTYGDKTYGYQGKAIYLDRDNGSLKGYQERGYSGEINNLLVSALKSGEISRIKEAADTVVEKAINSVNYKEGADYQRLMKKKMPHSISGHTSAVNMANIMTQEEYNEEKKKQAELEKSGNADYRKLLVSDINSFGVQLSRDVVESYLRAKKPNDPKHNEYSNKNLKKMLLGFGLDKKEDVEKMGRNEVIDLILKTLTIDMDDTSRWSQAYKSGKLKNGLAAVLGRFPFMNGLDLDTLTKVFIGKDVQGNQIKIGAGLAKKENADYDGDHENLKFMKLSGAERALFGKAAGMKEDVLRQLAWIAKREGEKKDAEMQVFDNNYYQGVSSDLVKQSALLAGRRNKGATGIFSNFASQIRNTMKDIGFDETNMGHGTQEETENAATAIIVRSYFEAMEQDMISAKKVIKRIIKETGMKAEDVTKETVEEYQKRMLEAVDGIIQQFYDGTITFDELNKQLVAMQIFDEEDNKIALTNRVTQSGLLTIEKLEGGKDFLRKISGGKYREFAMYGKATDNDVAFAQSFEEEGKGGYEAWAKTAEADALLKKLDAAGVKYENRDRDFYNMLISGKVNEEDFGTINQDMFMGSMDRITQYAQAHREAGIDGDPNSFLRTAKNKTHTPEKKNVENNPYHASNVPFTEAEKAAAEKMDENNANAMFGNAAAISDLSAELAGASGDIGKALAAILKYIINFSKGTIAVGNGIMSDTAGAKFLKESKFFKAPFSTTSVTGTVSPYEGISGDPALVDKIIANKNKKYLGYGSIEELRRNVGSGDAAAAALRGHVVGERTQFMQSLKEIARDKGWKGSENALIKKFKENLESLRAETDSSVQQTVSFYDAFQKDEKKYLAFLKAIHGKKGYGDEDFFLKKQHYKSYRDILKNAYLAQSKSLEVFFSPDKMAELNGKKAKTINEDAFIGAADASGDTNFAGRTDISGLIKQAVKNQDGSESTKNVLALVDQKTKLGKKLSSADILQGIMNAFAANEDIKLAKSFRNDDGSYDFQGWMNSAPIKALKERAEQAGLHLDWQQKFDTLVNADEAQSFIQKTDPKTGKTSFVSIDELFPTLQSKVIMAQVAKVMKGEVAPQELLKLINSRVASLADAGINIEGVDNGAIYADATEDEVTQAYLNLNKRKLELEEQKKELQYQIKDDTIEKNATDLQVLRDKLKQVNEDLDQTEKDIQEAVDTGARLDKFKKKVVDKNKTGAAETTEEVDVAEELKKEKKKQNLKYKQFTGSAQEQAAATYEDLLNRKNELEKNLAEAKIKQQYRYKVDGPEKLAANKKVIFESQQELEKINKRLEEGGWEKAVGAETYQELNAQYKQQAELNAQEVNNGTLLQAQQNSAERYNKLMKERIDLYEKQREIIYQIEHLSENATEGEKAALEAQKKEYANQLILKDKEIEEEAKTGIDTSKSKDSISNSQAQSDEKYNKFVEQKQDEAKKKLSSTLERMIQLRKGMKEREVRSSTVGTQGISKQQQIVNQLANEEDQKKYKELENSLKGVDWESSVGGAEAFNKILEDASASANLADRQIATLNSDLNPSIWTQMANSVKGWFSQLMRGQLVWKILGQVQRAIGTVIEDAKKLDSVLVNLQIVTGDTRENTRSLISTYASLAQAMSSTTSEVASAANDWLRQGYSISESIDLITASLQLSKLGMIDSGRATSYLTSMLKGFKLEASDATTVVDKLTKVDMSAATSAGDIAEALRQFATTAQLSGVDLDESIAMATTIMDVSQKDASSTGNAIKTMLSRYGNVKAGIYSGMNITGDQNETTESLNDIDKVLKKLGISLRSSNLEFRDFDDVLDDIAAKWETLDSVSKNAIATAMAGTRQRESFLVLMENYDKYKDFIDEAADAEGTAAEKYKAYEDSLEASQKKLAAAWEELASKTEVVDFFKQVNNMMATMVKYLPIIARTFIRMFSGRAAVNALNILQRSKSFSGFNLKGLKTGLKSSFDPTYGLLDKKTERTGRIDSQIRGGTKPILDEVKKIAQHVLKEKPGDGEKVTDKGLSNKDKNKDEDKQKTKKEALKIRSVAAATAGITGFMSADTQNEHKNQFTGESEVNETTNDNAKGIMKANAGIATALGTLFFGQAGGAIAGVVADFVNRRIIGPLIPAVRDENFKNDRFGQADKKKEQVEEAKSSITNVIDLASKETLTADDYSSLVKAQNELKDFMTKSENAGFKKEFVAYANKFLAGQREGNEYAAKSFDELTNLAEMTDAQRKKTAYALKVAQTKQENLAENAEYEKELDSLNTDLDSDYLDVSGYNKRAKALTAALTAKYAAGGAAVGAAAGHGVASWATGILGAAIGGMAGYAEAKAISEADKEATLASWNGKSRDEQIAVLEEMKAQGKGDSAKLTAMISKLQSINDTIKKIRDKMDQQRVEEGILEMSVGKNADGSDKTLLDLSQNALKDMGSDAIIEKMAAYLQDKYGGMADGSSYFYTDENGNKQVTAAARKAILKGLKSNEDIYSAVTGQNYRLSEVLGMKDGQTKTEILNNFANALHVSVEELQGLGTALGNFTLGDLTASAEELSSKFSDMQTAITNIASGTQSWATTLQSVAKTYPELLGYASDEYTLSLAMFQKMSDYKKLQTDAQMADIMANESYFDTFSDKLKDTLSDKEWEDFRNAQINSFNDLQQYVANNDTVLSKKLNEAAQAELKNIKLMSNEERQVLEKVVSIKNAQIDKEISNLTAQKEAMQNINSQREYENKLIEAKIRLENASKEKKRVWRAGVGWVYEEDQAAISEAKDNLDSVTNEKSISAVTKQIDQLNADKDYLSSILSDQEEATQRAFLQAYSDANGVTSDNITSLGSSLEETLNGNSKKANEKWDEWMEEYKKKEDNSKDTLKNQYDALQKAKAAMEDPNLSDEERARAQEAYNTALSNYQTTYNEGLSKGYWKASDFEEGGSMYEKFGGKNEATVAGAGGAGYTKAEPDQFLYQKDDNGRWNKFVYNPGSTNVLSSNDWNKFYDKHGKASADFYNTTFGDEGSNHKLKVNENSDDITAKSIYDAALENTTSNGFASWLESNFYGPSLARIGGQWTRFLGGIAYKLDAPKKVSENEVPEAVKKAGGSFKEGSTDISRGNRIPLLMNEEGSEAIVTPSGTITALPAHSGIIPADVTSNLWNLGNYAPDLLRALQRQTLLGMGISGTAVDNSVDNSVSINTVQMTVDADSGFNVDSFVQQLQQVAALTRNNRH